jgi:type IV secretory pathway TrbF-like protein
MSATHWTLPPEKDFRSAERQYVEQFGSVLVMNTYLKIAVLSLSLVSLALVALTIEIYRSARNVKPWVVRINEVGRAEAVPYQSFDYRPQEAEIKYFLIDFVQRHYSRMRATVKENYARSLFFLDGRLADALIEANKKMNTIETFLTGASDEIEVRINNVSIEDLRNPPYKATVDFEKIYRSAATKQETKREKYVGNFVFIVKENVSNSMIPVNPLGLTITYFHDNQAFQADPPQGEPAQAGPAH